MSRVVIRDLEKFPGLQPVSIILLYPGSHTEFIHTKYDLFLYKSQLNSNNKHQTQMLMDEIKEALVTYLYGFILVELCKKFLNNIGNGN